MNARELESVFATHGIRRGGALLLEDTWALALIDQAQEKEVAVVGVDQCRLGPGESYTALHGHALGLMIDRAASWRQAREFVTDFAGRGLLFEVVLEEPRVTDRARFRDRLVPFGIWSSVFQMVFLTFLLLLVAIMIGLG